MTTLKATFESQASFSVKSNVAQRLRDTFDYLDRVFPRRSDELRNRTLVQSFATLIAKLIAMGDQKGRESEVRRFFKNFTQELSRQVTLGQEATDLDYLEFQRTVNSNVRRNAQIRNQVLLRKLLLFDPNFADVFGTGLLAESGIAKTVAGSAKQIQLLIEQKNEEFARQHGTDLFKPTNKTAVALRSIGSPLRSYSDYRDWLDHLYFLFHESIGARLEKVKPPSFSDVNTLRTSERHDVDHGKPSGVRAKRIKFGAGFKKYSGETTPDAMNPEKLIVVQARLLQTLESDLRILKAK